jgi:prepilin-type N-terminal cleavage/methylation domain-containing protein
MKRRAFTLIELLVVMAVIGLLATIAVTALASAGINSRNARRRADMIQITKALELYYGDHSQYPSTAGASSCLLAGGGYYCGSCGTYGSLPNTDSPTAWIPGLTAGGYMARLPSDPNSGKVNPKSPSLTCQTDATHNCYIYRSDGISYALFAYCTPEGTWSSSDLFYSPGGAAGFEWKLTNDPVATSTWW